MNITKSEKISNIKKMLNYFAKKDELNFCFKKNKSYGYYYDMFTKYFNYLKSLEESLKAKKTQPVLLMDDISSHATSSKSLSIENVIPLAKSSLPVLSEEEHSHAMSSTNVMPEKPAITFANQTKPSI